MLPRPLDSAVHRYLEPRPFARKGWHTVTIEATGARDVSYPRACVDHLESGRNPGSRRPPWGARSLRRGTRPLVGFDPR